jgi:chromosome segregation ATPase
VLGKNISATVAIVLACSGCGAVDQYVQTSKDVNAGGPERRVDAAQQRLTTAQTENQTYNNQLAQINRDIDADQKRIDAAQSELRRTDTALAKARDNRRLSAEEYARLKKESDAINQELARLDVQLQADRGNPNAKDAVAEKQQKIELLLKRKRALEDALNKAIGT